MQYVMENESLKVTIDSHGAELVSVVGIDSGREYIWQADPDVWIRHAPVLFPIVGKCVNGEYTYDGKTYKIGQHGFARDMEFELVNKDSDSIVMKLTSNEKTHELYPFDFELFCMYELYGNTVTTDWRVVNTGNSEMYFSIGGHPAYIMDGSLIGKKLVFDAAKDELNYKLLDANGVTAPDIHKLKLADKSIVMDEKLFENDALIIEDNQSHSVTLAENDGKPVVKVCFDAPVFGLWSAKMDIPFVCIEPWYGRADANDSEGDFTKKDWIQKLGIGEEFQKGFTTYFYK